MRRLCDSDEVDAAVGQAAGFGGRNTVVDGGMVSGMTDLLGGGVGGDDLAEMHCQSPRRLAAAGGAIPGGVLLGAQAGEPGEQRSGIIQAIGGVAVGC